MRERIGSIDGERESTQYERRMEKQLRWIHKPLANHIVKQLTKESLIIADLGTGPGFLAIEIAKRLPNSKIIGVDSSENMLKISEMRVKRANLSNVQFKLGDVHNLPFEENYFDLVVSNQSLHHWDKPQNAFREIHRVLRSSGVAYISDLRRDSLLVNLFLSVVPLPQSPETIDGAKESLKCSYTIREVEDLLKGSEFRRIDVHKSLLGGWSLMAKLMK